MVNEITVGWRLVVFTLGISVVAGMFLGLAPALHASRLDVVRVLKQEGRSSTGSRDQVRTRRLLVVAEFALSLVLMIAATLLLRSFRDLINAPLGFDPQHVMIVRTRLPYPNDPREDLYATAADQAPFVREVLRRVSTLAGVQDAALGSSSAVPLDHPEQDQNVLRVLFEGRAADPTENLTQNLVTVYGIADGLAHVFVCQRFVTQVGSEEPDARIAQAVGPFAFR